MDLTVRRDTRCTTCGALIPEGAAWCSLCHTPVTPAAPEPPPEPVRPASAALPSPRTSGEAPQAPLRPEEDNDGGLGNDPETWAALLAAQESSTQPGYMRAMSRRSVRIVVGLAGAMALIVLFLVAMLIVGRWAG